MKFQIGVVQIRNRVKNKISIKSSTDLITICNRHKFGIDN